MQKTSEDTEAMHALLVQRMEAQQNPETAEWFNRYLKGAIRYRGLKTPSLSGILDDVFHATAADTWPLDTQLSHIRHWLCAPMAEDKLIAILWLKKWLKAQIKNPVRLDASSKALEMLEEVFGAGKIHDWSTNDWLCVRVLESIPEMVPELNERLMAWANAESIWQRRSSLLAFKKSAKNGRFHSEVEALITRLLPSDERFIQTAIGWVLSDASRNYGDWASKLFDIHFEALSHEVIVRHTNRLPNHAELKRRSRARKSKV